MDGLRLKIGGDDDGGFGGSVGDAAGEIAGLLEVGDTAVGHVFVNIMLKTVQQMLPFLSCACLECVGRRTAGGGGMGVRIGKVLQSVGYPAHSLRNPQ